MMRRSGLMVPSAFEAWPTATIFTRGFSIRSYSSTSSSPSSLTGMTRTDAPFSCASICQGTMLE